jgi:hypothetical protein
MDQVKKFLRDVALNVSRLTEEIANKLDDKEEKEPTQSGAEVNASPSHAEESVVDKAPEKEEVKEEVKPAEASNKSSVEKERETNVEADKAENQAIEALQESKERRDDQNKMFEANTDDFLIDGEDYVEKAEEKKHDIEYMKKCCDLELRKMEEKNQVPVPFYFERVAILSKKEKNYEQEVKYCEDYVNAVNQFYEKNNDSNVADARKTVKYQALIKRMEKAKNLLYK